MNNAVIAKMLTTLQIVVHCLWKILNQFKCYLFRKITVRVRVISCCIKVFIMLIMYLLGRRFQHENIYRIDKDCT